jgi:putative Holliday junction resolvase
MNILAIDYGTKNIGLARASTTMDLVLPFGVISNEDHTKALTELSCLIVAEKIDTIVMGLPTGLDGTENSNTVKIRNFADQLKKQVSIPVVFITEIFSSQAADRMGAGVSRDEKSAMIILESYLQKQMLQH